MSGREAAGDPGATDIDALLARYSPDIARDLRAARTGLATLVPRGYELVYDTYNALVFAFGPTTRAGDAVVSVAGYPRWVTLFFANGSTLRDPDRVLEGGGKRIRSVRLQPASRLASLPVRALLDEALGARAADFAAAPPRATIVKSIAATQRARRPA